MAQARFPLSRWWADDGTLTSWIDCLYDDVTQTISAIEAHDGEDGSHGTIRQSMTITITLNGTAVRSVTLQPGQTDTQTVSGNQKMQPNPDGGLMLPPTAGYGYLTQWTRV